MRNANRLPTAHLFAASRGDMVAREDAPAPETARDYAAWAHRLYSAGDRRLTDAALTRLREPTAVQVPAFHLLRSLKHLEVGDRPGAMALVRKAVGAASEEDRDYYSDLLFAMEFNWDSPAAARLTLESTVGNIDALGPALLAARSIMAADEGALSESAALADEALARCPPEHPLQPHVFMRTGFSAFVRSEFELAEDLSSRAVALAEMFGLRRIAWAAYSVLHEAAFEWRRDHDLSRYCGERMTEIAAEMNELQAESHGLLVQLNVASFAGEEERYVAIRDKLLRRRASSEYSGQFLTRTGEVLHLGAKGRFGDARRLLERGLADPLCDYPLSHCYRALYLALLGAVMVGIDDLDEARRFVRRAISETRRSVRFEYPTERWIRADARSVAAAVCVIIGDNERARRAMSGEFEAHIAFVNLFSIADPDLESIPKRSRGYAVLLATIQRVYRARHGTGFTPAELLVISALRDGATNAEIAAALSKSPATVKMQLQSVYQKLGVHSRANAIRRLRERELNAPSAGVACMASAGERAAG